MTSDSSTIPPLENTSELAGRSTRNAQVLIILVSVLLHGVFLNMARPLQSANDRSRWCTVWSLVERGTFQIDEIRQRPGWDTIDMIRDKGHYYSTKPPLLTVVVAGITWCVQRVTGWSLNNPGQLQSITTSVLWIINLLPFAMSLFAWMALLDRLTVQAWTRLLGVTIAAFGTLLSPFLMTLNNHTVAAASTMFAIYALARMFDTNGDSSKSSVSTVVHHPTWAFVLCGFATAWTVANELPAAAFFLFAFLMSFRCSASKTLIYFLPAAAIPIAALIVTNVIVTGSWKPTYADYGSEKYRFVVDGVPSYWMEPRGIDKNIDSPPTYFLHCTIGHHGIFSLTPIALLSLWGWLMVFFQKNHVLRNLLWSSGVTFVIVIAFYLSRTQNYNYGGVSCGLRWSLWMTPFWLVALAPALDSLRQRRLANVIALVLVSVSICSAWSAIENPWRQPWLFQWMESRGWIDYSDEVPQLKHPLWSWFASLPETTADQPAFIEFEVAQPATAKRTVRVSVRPSSGNQSSNRIDLEVNESFGDGSADRIRQFQIDKGKFAAGLPPADFVVWSDAGVTEQKQQSDYGFVRGLPRKVPFSARAIRYLKTPIRREAFRCHVAAAHVIYSAKEGEPASIYRCETWLTDDVPFGVAQVEFRVSHPDNGSVLFQERWTVHDCWPKPLSYQQP